MKADHSLPFRAFVLPLAILACLAACVTKNISANAQQIALAQAPESSPVPPAQNESSSGNSQAPENVFSREQIEALVERVTANQHRNDSALLEFQRTEHIVARNTKGAVIGDRLTTVVPAGVRLVRVELARDAMPADPAILAQQWQLAIQALERETKTSDPDVKENDDREVRRQRQRAEMVDTIGRAFRFQFIRKFNERGRALLEFNFEPNPSFHSSALYAVVFADAAGTVWVDENANQVVRVDARLRDNLTIAAGLIAKIYRGSGASLQQSEVAPGVWEPIHYAFDFEGRKLVFGTLSGHEVMDATDYRRLGPLNEALATIRREHSDPPPASSH